MRTNTYQPKILSLFKKKHMLSIAEINNAIPKADYSTVFRNMEKLFIDKKVKKIVVDKKTIMYELIKNTHGHFICNKCGKIESIYLPLENIAKGKTVSDLTLRGLCSSCTK